MLGWWEMPWRWAIGLFSVFGIVCGVLFLPNVSQHAARPSWANEAEAQLIVAVDPQAAQATHSLVQWDELLKSVSFWFLLVRAFAANLADVVYVYWVPLYLLEEKQLGHSAAGWLAALPLIGGALGGVCSGSMQSVLIRRTGNRRWAVAWVSPESCLRPCSCCSVCCLWIPW